MVGVRSGRAGIQPADRVRQIGVTVAEVLCIVGSLVGAGILGSTPVEDSAGGVLATGATILTPAGTAFAIWSVIYLGLAVYTVWQWFPAVATQPRVRRTGWLVAVTMLLNAAWLLVTQMGWVVVSVVVILALAITLGIILRRLSQEPAASVGERIILDGTVGIYTGWVAVATFANVAAAFASGGLGLGPVAGQVVGIACLLLVIGLAWVIGSRFGALFSVAAAMAWGLVWIGVGRLGGDPAAPVLGWAALIAAAAVIAVMVGRQLRSSTPRTQLA